MAAIPYARRAYQPGGSRISDILLRQGDIAAERERRSGESAAQAWHGVGQAATGALGDIVRYQQDAPRREMERLQLEEGRAAQTARKQGTESASILQSAQSSGLPADQIRAQLMQLGRGDLVPIYEKAQSDLDASRLNLQKLRDTNAAAEADYFGSLAASIKAAKFDPIAVEWALGEADKDGHDTKQLRQRLQQQPDSLPQIVESLIQRSPTQMKIAGEAADRALKTKQEDRAIRTAEATAADRVADNARQATTAAETARHNAAMEKLQRDTAMSTAARASATAAETARHNRAMEESARNRTQGRPVIAGDAEDISNFDTGLDNLNALAKDLGTTGAESWAESKIPDVVTSWTGWGEDAKSRQGTIDRVKQVIGKTLEGGVLRKEDEIKYAKILPKIGDSPAVAASKLQGLWKAIQKQRETRLDSLEDAGYNVSKYRARAPRAQDFASDAAKVTVTAPNGKTYSFASQAEADAFKQKAGIQ